MRVEGAFPVTMLPGDGVGPELMHAVKEVFKVSDAGKSAGTDYGGGLERTYSIVTQRSGGPVPEGCLCPSGVPGASPERGAEYGIRGEAGAGVEFHEGEQGGHHWYV